MFRHENLLKAMIQIFEKFKARLVTFAFHQIRGLDYKEKIAPVVKFSMLTLLLAIFAH